MTERPFLPSSIRLFLVLATLLPFAVPADAGEARQRWERMNLMHHFGWNYMALYKWPKLSPQVKLLKE